MIHEILEQMPLIMTGTPPNHTRCINISTNASLWKMIAPGALVICTPLVMGLFFGYRCVSGLLAGNIVSGIQIAFSASNTGGAWVNAKKSVEAGLLNYKSGPKKDQAVVKG